MSQTYSKPTSSSLRALGVCACVFFGILYGQTGLIVSLIATQSWLIALIIRNWHRQYKITKRILENRQVSQEDYNKAMEYIVKEAEKQKD